MESACDLTRFGHAIPDPETGHAWALRANRATVGMEFECVRCGRVERLASIEQWDAAVETGFAHMIVRHKAAWTTVRDACPQADAPMPRLHLEEGPL